jgi:2-dehydro-3-deoxyphosphogluconate aldolase/(4S)-4-hydroxy-2-oxoglutarate aldolase
MTTHALHPTATRSEITARLLDPGIIAIVRAPDGALVDPVARALVAGGVRAVEVTLTTPNATEAIALARAALGQEALVGAGTVLTEPQCAAVLAAGAQFVVSPIGRSGLVPLAHAAAVPIMLGACTPTEAQAVHEAGADFVKLFPADNLGPAYVRALRAPLPHLRIVPTGGVDLETAVPFLRAGCVALGVGSSLVSAQILRDRDWAQLTRLAAAFVERIRSTRSAQ